MKNTQTQYTMTKNKMGYEAPTIDILELRVEGGILTLSFGADGAAGGDPGLNDDKYNYGSF